MGPKRHANQGDHFHLPSVHIRRQDGSGYDYEEDLFIKGITIRRLVTLNIFDADRTVVKRQTHDTLCAEEAEALVEALDVVMDEENPEMPAIMKAVAEAELVRQQRILAGQEKACADCGCSESRGCSGGCIWATGSLCSRCAPRTRVARRSV